MIELIQKAFSDTGLRWWVDSGSLLGLYRDGRFLPNDADIDITLFVHDRNDAEKVEHAVEIVKRLGFRCVRLMWGSRDKTYKYKLIPENAFPYKLDIMICFVQPDGSAVCPQGKKNTQNIGSIHRIRQICIDWKKGNTVRKKAGLKGKVYYYSYQIYRNLFLRNDAELNIQNLSPEFYTMLYWEIPAKFIEKISGTTLDGFPIPEDSDGYLRYRYGDWRIPNSHWNFTTDDGAIRTASKEQINTFLDR
ncbi:MAG: LicD family protein [Sphaerochaetaceae bacterium]|nr:LicD family protein [Sphaerochaetaceae bacterium]